MKNNTTGLKHLKRQLESMLGDLGMERHRLLDHSIYLHKGDDITEIPTPGENAYLLEIEDLAAAIRGDREQLIAPAETVRNLRVIERLRESAGLD